MSLSSFSIRLALAGLLCTSTLAHAADRPAALKALEEQGLSIVGEFDAPGGLKAWGAYSGNRALAIYNLPDGQHMMVGTMIDANGEEVRPAGLDELVQPAIAKDMLGKLEKSRWIKDGDDKAPRVVYVFTDPNCPYCMQFWQMARPWVESGKVQLRHIMVGILAPSSSLKSAGQVLEVHLGWAGKGIGQRIGDKRVALAFPQTYMNESGRSAGPAHGHLPSPQARTPAPAGARVPGPRPRGGPCAGPLPHGIATRDWRGP